MGCVFFVQPRSLNVIVEVPFELLFLHKNALVSLKIDLNKPRAFIVLQKKFMAFKHPFQREFSMFMVFLTIV